MRWHLSTAVACSRLSGNRFKIRKLITAMQALSMASAVPNVLS